MKRHVSAAVIALVAALAVTAAAVAAVAPGAYKGNLYTGATKQAPATVTVAGSKVTITVPKFPVKCLAATGAYTQPGPAQKFVWKGTLKGNKVSGNYIDPARRHGRVLHGQGHLHARDQVVRRGATRSRVTAAALPRSRPRRPDSEDIG